MADVRVGLGFDVHPRDPARPLLLGGVAFEGDPGLAGHSDADAVCHAVADAVLGAAAIGDLGRHFPDTDQAWAGASGLDLLRRSVAMVDEAGYRPSSCDLTVLAERPAIGPRAAEIQANLAQALGVEPGRVSVKATRPEGLGLTGEGVGCLAVVVLEPR